MRRWGPAWRNQGAPSFLRHPDARLYHHVAISLCLSPAHLCLPRTLVLGFRATRIIQDGLETLNLITSAKTLCPGRSHLQVLGTRTWTHLLGGAQFSPLQTLPCLLISGPRGSPGPPTSSQPIVLSWCRTEPWGLGHFPRSLPWKSAGGKGGHAAAERLPAPARPRSSQSGQGRQAEAHICQGSREEAAGGWRVPEAGLGWGWVFGQGSTTLLCKCVWLSLETIPIVPQTGARDE